MDVVAKEWIERLGLTPHPEGGYFRETYRSEFSTAIYFLLPGEQVSALHRLQADEGWHFYAGTSLTLAILHPTGTLESITLGTDAARGHRFQFVVPGNRWFGAAVDDPVGWTLVGCTTAPPFEFSDFELGDPVTLLSEFPQHRAVITRLTR